MKLWIVANIFIIGCALAFPQGPGEGKSVEKRVNNIKKRSQKILFFSPIFV